MSLTPSPNAGQAMLGPRWFRDRFMRVDVGLLYGMMRLLALLPLRAMHGIGAALGWLMWRVGRRGRHQARVNIGLARPRLPVSERERLVRAAMLESGR